MLYSEGMNNNAAPAPRTSAIFDAFAKRDEFLGFGYIGCRQGVLESVETGERRPAAADQVAAADAYLLEVAAGMTDDQLFEWANSKNGRWFADTALGGFGLERARIYGPRI